MNIIKYVGSLGDLTFKERPFTRVDSLVLCQITYLLFEEVLTSNNTSIFIRDLAEPTILEKLCKDTLEPKKNKGLINNLVKSNRFKDIEITRFEHRFSEKTFTQFAAMVFIEDNFIFYGFRGTDITINGWKEDLLLAIKCEVRSQKLAREYLNKHLDLQSKKHIYIGGHSKGGNLAKYAAYSLSEASFKNVDKVFDLDGPGFNDSVVDSEKYNKVKNKVDKVIPRNSSIGIIFDQIEKKCIIRSLAITGIQQHDPFRWYIDKNGEFYTYNDTTKTSKSFSKAIKTILESFTKEELKILIFRIFTLFDESKIENVKELGKRPLSFIAFSRKFFKNDEEETKTLINYFLKASILSFVNERFTLVTRKKAVKKGVKGIEKQKKSKQES